MSLISIIYIMNEQLIIMIGNRNLNLTINSNNEQFGNEFLKLF